MASYLLVKKNLHLNTPIKTKTRVTGSQRERKKEMIREENKKAEGDLTGELLQASQHFPVNILQHDFLFLLLLSALPLG